MGLAAIQRWPTRQSKTWTARFLEGARDDKNIGAVVGVGSTVRKQVPSVDLDLVVLVDAVDLFKVRAPIEIDLRAYPVSKVDSLIANGSDLLGWAVMYGKVLLEKHSVWDDIVTRWRSKVPLPSPDIAARRAQDALRRFWSMIEIGDESAAAEQALSFITHMARKQLIERKIYPASRPELPAALRGVGCIDLADALDEIIESRWTGLNGLKTLVERASLACGEVKQHPRAPQKVG